MDSGTDAPPRKFSFKRVGGLHSPAEEDEVVVDRFNVFLVEDFEVELRLRSHLFENGLEKDKEPQRDVILISSLGMWAIEVGICGCHSRWTLYGDSWEDFTRRHLLRDGDVIWIEVVGDMVWRAHVVDNFSCCEKVLTVPAGDPTTAPPPAKKKKRKGKAEEEAADQFTAEITELHTRVNYLNLPRSFLKGHKCVQMHQRAILVDSKGNAWEMAIYIPGAKQGDFRYVQFRGWHSFVTAHGLEVGDSCTFKLDEDSPLATTSSFVMKVQITK